MMQQFWYYDSDQQMSMKSFKINQGSKKATKALIMIKHRKWPIVELANGHLNLELEVLYDIDS